ncbi:MAG: IS66 family transposase [Anaerolineales bacterium]|nr:IS66 family transposase [Anaerolineales bacterium]
MLTRDEILVVYAAGPEAVVALVEQLLAAHQAHVAELTARLERLEAQIGKDSHNSHKPPSSDGPAKLPRQRSQRKRSGKKSGGQVGHVGVTLRPVAQPNAVVPHAASVCGQCGADLAAAPVVNRECRQVLDLPPSRPQVTEHQVLHQCCPQCQAISSGQFPAEVTQPIQYGPEVKALAVYLQEYQLLPFERTQEFFKDVCQLSWSEGTLAQVRETCAERLEPVENAIKAALGQAPVLNCDETGLRVAGHTNWLHVLATASLTYFAQHAKRGREAMTAIGVLPNFTGTAVHDGLGAYFRYGCQHALCKVHLLRELTAVSEGTRQRWPQRLADWLLKIKARVARALAAGHVHLSQRQIKAFTRQYEKLIHTGLRSNPPPSRTGRRGRPRQGPIRSLLVRLKKHQAAVLAFMHDFRVPFDNNQAERDLRMAKVRQKISGGFRSPHGADLVCRIRGYISTMRKQGHSPLTALRSVFAGQILMPRLTAE